ncbi:MAG: mechanosensitive ion channel [Salinivirgaceae bacterium]|jgi:small conductance mechanosensitive channel|nr:mechanosensitive ion channel [Salinivirgaceae bacterium]
MEKGNVLSVDLFQRMLDFVFEFGPRLLGAIVVLIVGLFLVKLITRSFVRLMEKRELDVSLLPFLRALVNIALKALVVISVMSMIGVEMTSFIALLGAAGLAIGLALSGTLQNFAGGIVLLVLRPFQAGHFIEAQGYMGTVKEVGVFHTILSTPDKKVIIIPNGPLSSGALTNFSREPQRRVDWTFGIAYGDDVEDFKKAINTFLNEDDRILKNPESFIGLTALADSSVNFAVRAWVNADDYWSVFFDMNEKVYKRFADYNLNIPFPQVDMHVHNEK